MNFKSLKKVYAYMVWGLFLLLAARLLLFVKVFAVDIPFMDQWDFLTPIFAGDGWWSAFNWQHGSHRQGVGGVMLAVLYGLTDWDLQVECLVSACIIIAVCVVYLRIKSRCCGPLTWHDGVIPLVCLTLLHYEMFIYTPNPAYGPLPALLAALVALVLTLENSLVKYFWLTLLSFAATYTGYGFFIGVLVPCFLLTEAWRNRRIPGLRNAAVMACLVAALGTASFFHNYHWGQPELPCYKFPCDRPNEYFVFVALMIDRALGAVSMSMSDRAFDVTEPFAVGRLWVAFIEYAAFFLVFLRTAWLQLRGRATRLDQVILFLSTFTLLFTSFAAIGRVCGGLVYANSSRYTIHSMPGVIALYLAAVNWSKTTRRGLIAVFFILGLLLYREARTHFHDPEFVAIHRAKSSWAACIRTTNDIQTCNNVAGIEIYPRPQGTHLQEKLNYLRERHLSLFKE